MQDPLVGRGNVAPARMTRNSASMQSLQAAGHAAALADGLVGNEGGRSSGRLGAATRSSATHGGSRGMKSETGLGGGGQTGDTNSTSAGTAVAPGSSSADTMLGVMLGGGGSGGGSGGGVQKKQKPPGLRRGKWTTEEEKYANRLIHEFKAGLLPLTDGTTLRTFLSIMLNCDPMRISKKFVGSNCIGKQVFRRNHGADTDSGVSEEAMGKSWMELADLERNFLERVAETTSKLKHGGGGAAAAASGYGRSPLSGNAAAPASAASPPTTRTSGAVTSSEQMGLRSNSGSWRGGVDDNDGDVKPSVNGAGGKQAFGQEQSGENGRTSTTNSTPSTSTTLATIPATRQRKLRSRPQIQQPVQQKQQQQESRREKTSQSSVNAKAPRKKGGKSSGVETKPEEENEERTERGVVGPGDGVSPNAAASSAVSNPPPATGRPSGADGSRKRAMCPGANPGVRGRKPKLSPRRVKGEGVGKGKEELAGGEGRAEAGNDGEKVVAASAAQQRCHKQLEEKREEQREQQQKEQQQQMHEEQRLLQQQQQHRQQQESVQMPLHHPMFLQHNPQHQHQAFMQQQIHQHQQQPAIGNPALGFDSDGGPVPRVQSLNTLPANPPISGSLSVQNLAMLLGMGGAGGGGVEAFGGNCNSSGVSGGGTNGGGGVVSNNFQATGDLAGVAGAMRSTPSSSVFLRNNFDIQLENVNLIHLQQQQQQQQQLPHPQQQPQLTIPPHHGPTNISGGADGGPGGSGVAMLGGGNLAGGINTMQMVVPHLFLGGRRTSAEDFLSLLQDSEELQAREAQQVREESEERSQSPLTAGPGPPRLSSPLPSGPGLASLSSSAEHGPQGGQIGKPGQAEGDDNELSTHSVEASPGVGCNIGVGVDGGIGAGDCTRAGERTDGRGKAELTAFVNGGGMGGGGGIEARGVGRGIFLGIVPGSGTVPGTREIVEDDQGSEDMYLVGETAEREEDEDEQGDGTGDIAGVLSNGLRTGGGTGHLELKMGLDQESC